MPCCPFLWTTPLVIPLIPLLWPMSFLGAARARAARRSRAPGGAGRAAGVGAAAGAGAAGALQGPHAAEGGAGGGAGAAAAGGVSGGEEGGGAWGEAGWRRDSVGGSGADAVAQECLERLQSGRSKGSVLVLAALTSLSDMGGGHLCCWTQRGPALGLRPSAAGYRNVSHSCVSVTELRQECWGAPPYYPLVEPGDSWKPQQLTALGMYVQESCPERQRTGPRTAARYSARAPSRTMGAHGVVCDWSNSCAGGRGLWLVLGLMLHLAVQVSGSRC